MLHQFELKQGRGTADYMLNVDSKASGGAEPKPVDHSLTYVKLRSKKYGEDLPEDVPHHGHAFFATCSPEANQKPPPLTAQ